MNSLSEENYLKTILRIAQKKQKVTPTAIAEMLEHNPASVLDMIKKLTEKQLVVYDKKNGAILSEKGNKAALDILRRHRLWEVFLLEKLGYKWDEIHDIAEQLEHIQQADLADRLDAFLGYPSYDPHGDPIPKSDGKMPKISKTTLAELKVATESRVVAVKDTSSAFLQYLQQLKIGIGTSIKLIEKIAFDDSVVVQIDSRYKATVSKKFADSILVG